jgi:hypothetical protein
MSKRIQVDRSRNHDAPEARRAEGLRQFCSSISVSYDSGFRAVQSGRLKHVRFGKKILIPADECARVLREGL